MTIIMSLSLTNILCNLDYLLDTKSEIFELFDLEDSESEKEEEKKEEKSDDKIPISTNLGDIQSGILWAKAQNTLKYYSVFHPEILTPPPESHHS